MLGIGVAITQRWTSEKHAAEGVWKCGEVLVEDRADAGRQSEERALRVASGALRESRQQPVDLPAQDGGGQRPVGSAQPLIPGSDPIPVVAEEELVSSLAG